MTNLESERKVTRNGSWKSHGTYCEKNENMNFTIVTYLPKKKERLFPFTKHMKLHISIGMHIYFRACLCNTEKILSFEKLSIKETTDIMILVNCI